LSKNRVERTATVRSTGCQTGLYNRIDNRLYTQYSRLSKRFDNRLYGVNRALDLLVTQNRIFGLEWSEVLTGQTPYLLRCKMTCPHQWLLRSFPVTSWYQRP